MCATLCSFCKKSASKLVPHYLCDCCLVHLECCEATAENRLASLTKTIIPDEDDTFEKVDCEICLETYSEDDLEEHQEMCTARVVFRCSVCDGDYVNKERLWNHLDQHEIADESKELHYQEMRATYKLYKCVLCNDQRGYQESLYWRHVHEDHDGFFLRCLDCGENFRSEKRKTDHALSHCNARKQSETSDSTALELDEGIGILFLSELALPPEKHDDNLISPLPEVSTKICKLKSLTLPEKSDFHLKNGDLTYADQENVDSRFSKDPPEGNCDGDIVDNNTMELKIEGDISQPSLEKTSIVITDKKSSNCDKEFNDETMLARHIDYCHQPITCEICGITVDNRNQIRYHKQTYHSITKYNCNQCNQTFNTQKVFYKHMAAHDKVSKLHCTICTLQFEDSPTLRSHMEFDHNIKPVRVVPRCTCAVCGVRVAGRLRLAYHMLKCHTEPKFQCSHCPRKFVAEGNYLNHLQSHKSLRKCPCKFCSLKYKRVHHLKAHIESRHGNEQPVHVLRVHQDKSRQSKTISDEGSVVACEEIDIKHEIPITLASSSATECSQCNQMFSDSNELQDHLRVSHRSIECLICELPFANAARLRNHNLSHMGPQIA